MLRERNWMLKFEACGRIRKRLATIWIFKDFFYLYKPTQRENTTICKCALAIV